MLLLRVPTSRRLVSGTAQSPTLVVCPLSLMDQWVDEIERCSAGAATVLMHYGNSSGSGSSGSGGRLMFSADVVVTSYGTLVAEWRAAAKGTSGSSCCRLFS